MINNFHNFCKIVLFEVVWAHFQKICPNDPKKGDFENVRTTVKLCRHLLPSVGALPTWSESCLEQVGKTPFLVSFGHILKKSVCKKIFFFENQILFQLPPPFLILFHLLLPLFLELGFSKKPKCAFPTQKRGSTKVPQ